MNYPMAFQQNVKHSEGGSEFRKRYSFLLHSNYGKWNSSIHGLQKVASGFSRNIDYLEIKRVQAIEFEPPSTLTIMNPNPVQFDPT